MPVDLHKLPYCLHSSYTDSPAQVELVASRLLSRVVGLSKEDITHINC